LFSKSVKPLVETQIRTLILFRQTPNKILNADDIPRIQRNVGAASSFPQDKRYTAQWLTTNEDILQGFLNNTDAAFKKKCSKNTLPSLLLLDYNYGAAALRAWGCNLEDFNELQHSRPPKGSVSASGPAFNSRTDKEHAELGKKRDGTHAAKGHGNVGQGITNRLIYWTRNLSF